MTTSEVCTEIERLDAPDAPGALRAAGEDARGFLGLDPVTQNDPLILRELNRMGAQVYRSEETLLGYLVNPEQPRQAIVATTSDDPEPLRAFLSFLGTYQRCSTFVAMLTEPSAAAAAMRACGFAVVGTLPQHTYRSGRYHDVSVHFATLEDVCPS